jgi:hypothetical protein
MQIVYRKIVEVQVQHDYFLLPGVVEKFAGDYTVSQIFNIEPSPDTVRLMQDYKMIFRSTPSGFVILVKSDFINSAVGYATSVDFLNELSFTFYWTLVNPYFLNYTNQRILEKDKKIYYFSNLTGSVGGTVRYLNKAIPAFGTTYLNEPLYRLGDIVSESGATFELIEKESPVTNFPANAAKWQKINNNAVNYVNPNDRISLLSSRYVFERLNSNPGEFISARLLDVNNHEIPLGFISGTNQPQNEYRTPLHGNDPVNFILDFSRLNTGFYTLEISEISGITLKPFYLMHPMVKSDLFGVSSFFVSVAAPSFRFIKEDPVLKRWIIDNPHKKFTIRFRNRLTRWKYLNQDESVFNQPPTPRPLTKIYSRYTIPGPGGTTVNLPDPEVNNIYPELEASTNLIKNIYSTIFLNK